MLMDGVEGLSLLEQALGRHNFWVEIPLPTTSPTVILGKLLNFTVLYFYFSIYKPKLIIVTATAGMVQILMN